MIKYILSILLSVVFIKNIHCDVIVYSRLNAKVMEEFRDLPAHFGPSLPATGYRYLTIESEPRDACKDIAPPPNENQTNVKWAVIISRYNCSFEEKVRHAQAANFDAAIVYNVGSNELEQMSAKNEDGILIPSIFVGERTGHILIKSYRYEDDYAVIINDDLPFNINTNLIVPFSIVVGLCFITMIAFMVVKCIREQRRLRRHRLPSNLLKKIPTIKYAKGDSYETCAICLDDFADGDKLRVLPCDHAYHTKCIDPWLTKNRRVCPICKRKVFARGEPRSRRRRSSSDSMSDTDDDRRPLINPVENSTNHGTFNNNNNNNSSSGDTPRDSTSINNSVGEESTSTSGEYRPPPRTNPFDRVVPDVTSQNDSDTLNKWERFKRLFHRRQPLNSSSDDAPTSVLVHSTAAEMGATAAAASTTSSLLVTPPVACVLPPSSNNVLNKNLSGSFINDETDDDLPILLNPNTNTGNNNNNNNNSNNNSNDTAIRRLGVAAIPNTSFNPSSSNARTYNNTQFI